VKKQIGTRAYLRGLSYHQAVLDEFSNILARISVRYFRNL